MKEHYVSYSQAVKLKELGFDWKCYDFYDGNKRLLESSIFSHTYRVSDYWHNFNEYDRDNHRQSLYVSCSAPRLDQAQAWLRDKRHYEVNAFWCYDYSKWESYAYDMTMPSLMGTDPLDISFDTYEQALSAGIDKALELLTNKPTAI